MKAFLRILYLIAINLLVTVLAVIIVDPFLPEPVEDSQGLKRNVLLKELGAFANYTIIPSNVYMAGTDGLVKKKYSVKTDQNGFVIGYKNYSVDSSQVDIIFFGGSTTACLFVDEDKRFPLLVQGSLVKKHNGLHPNILNGGVSGNNTLHSLVNLIAKGLPLRPKVIVVMEAVNDLSLLSKTGSYWTAPSTKAIVQNEKRETLNLSGRIAAFGKSTKNLLFPNLYNRMFIAVSKMRQGKNEIVSANEDEFADYRNNPVPEFSVMKTDYKQMLLTLIRVAKTNNIKVVLMTQFNRLVPEDTFIKAEYNRHIHNIDYGVFCSYYTAFNQITREVATSEKLPLIELDQVVPKTKAYIYDAVHLNNVGSEFVASVVSEKLSKIFPTYNFQTKR